MNTNHDPNLMNRLGNSHNPHQGPAKRVLCVCSAGLLRSPTIAHVLAQEPYNFNTRAAGSVPEFALIPVDDVLINWAEEIVFAEAYHFNLVREHGHDLTGKRCIILDIPDRYRRRDPELEVLIRDKYNTLRRD